MTKPTSKYVLFRLFNALGIGIMLSGSASVFVEMIQDARPLMGAVAPVLALVTVGMIFLLNSALRKVIAASS